MLQILDWNSMDQDQRQSVLARPASSTSAELARDVAAIIAEVRRGGDAALAEFTRRFDGVATTVLRVPEAEIHAAAEKLSVKQREALETARDNILVFHEAQRSAPISVTTQPGVECRRVTRPIDAVGLYVPAGSAPLPSTTLMLAIPAAVAACPRRVLVTPARSDGRADSSVLASAALTDIDEVYVVGGAQAIAALAYGTDSIAPVDKVFGPGNAWVTEAKLQVSRDPRGAACDLPAGPSEVLVIADGSALPDCIAADLLSQAEHGPDSQVLLVATSERLADQVREQVEAQLAQLPRAAIAGQALENSRIVLAGDLDQAIAISNEYAPEHLILATEDAESLLDAVTAAGSVFLGHWTPESLGDYCSGTNHVLPTYGFARAFSGLGVEDFQRRITVQTASADGLRGIGPTAMTLARLEGLEAHASAVERRLLALADRIVA
jgi:histidinol dehydrogenase